MSTASEPRGKQLAALTLAGLGVIYGDIGTSPLYALRMCFTGPGGVSVATPDNVFGVTSLILWALLILITFKYLNLVLRADNRGEGGILALMALLRRESPERMLGQRVTIALGLFGAALLYGDGLITPAISVLSAIEGVNVATNRFEHFVVPLALIILVALFWVQHHGTQRVGTIFGPVMLLWFLVLALLGLGQIVHAPGILRALNPWHGIAFIQSNHWHAFLVLGSVFLAVTGGEALYADMGHFGRRSIRVGWYSLVLPALALNYLGQGAYLLSHPGTSVENLFYRLAPGWALYPLVVLATAATVIASQAVISGAFSLTRQAIQLGYCPRLDIIHTSEETIGQVYMPLVNYLMLAGTVALVLGFRTSDSLAGAYGVAVATTMLITTIMLFSVMRSRWHWKLGTVLLLACPLLVLDLAFFASNILKLREGGWVPVSLAAASFIMMTTWHRGRELLGQSLAREGLSVDDFLADVSRFKPLRVPGTALFLAGNPHSIPRTLLHNFKHNRVLHERNLLLHVRNEEVPHVPEDERITVKELEHGFATVTVRYGFSEDPDIPAVLKRIEIKDVNLNPLQLTYFLGRVTLIVGPRRNMQRWRKHLFSVMALNARDASKFFHLPPNRVIEIGIQVEL